MTTAARPIHVAFLALQPPGLSPGQRQRVEAFESGLARRGVQVQTHAVLGRNDVDVFYGRHAAPRKALLAGAAAVRRLASLMSPARVDAYLVQREAFFLGGPWSEWLASLRAPVIYDFDDAIWIRTMSDANRGFAWLKNVDKIPRIVGLAHTVIAGNDYLAEWARQHSGNVHVVPTCIDTDHFAAPARTAGDVVTIGWSGSASTLAHLRPLMPALERVVARCGQRVRIRVMGDPAFEHPPLRLRGEAWSPAAEIALLQEMSIGLMPLPDDEWTRGKCGFKGLLSMAMGAATVMSPVGVNTEIVRHGENGFLAASEDEWVELLCRLVDDAALRTRVGQAGRQTVVDRYSVRRWEATLAGLVTAAVEGSPARSASTNI
jgi:glycosyltransferase involved in cell wall biosynthesis